MAKTQFIILFLSIIIFSAFAQPRFFPDRIPKKPVYGFTEYSSVKNLFRHLEGGSAGGNQTGNSSELITMTLRGGTYLGYYYVTLYFGTPLQRQTLIVDTGSPITTIPCQGFPLF